VQYKSLGAVQIVIRTPSSRGNVDVAKEKITQLVTIFDFVFGRALRAVAADPTIDVACARIAGGAFPRLAEAFAGAPSRLARIASSKPCRLCSKPRLAGRIRPRPGGDSDTRAAGGVAAESVPKLTLKDRPRTVRKSRALTIVTVKLAAGRCAHPLCRVSMNLITLQDTKHDHVSKRTNHDDAFYAYFPNSNSNNCHVSCVCRHLPC
jgi:hypothetical protein